MCINNSYFFNWMGSIESNDNGIVSTIDILSTTVESAFDVVSAFAPQDATDNVTTIKTKIKNPNTFFMF